MRWPRMVVKPKPCSKVPHGTYKRAIKEADRMRAAHPDTLDRGGDFQAYYCDVCHTWHTGRRWNIKTTHDLHPTPAGSER